MRTVGHPDLPPAAASSGRDPCQTCACAGGIAAGGLVAGGAGFVLTGGTVAPPVEVFALLFWLGAGVGFEGGRWLRRHATGPNSRIPCRFLPTTIRLGLTLVLAYLTFLGLSGAVSWLYVSPLIAIPVIAVLCLGSCCVVGRGVRDAGTLLRYILRRNAAARDRKCRAPRAARC